MPRLVVAALLSIFGSLVLAGCHTMRFEFVNVRAGEVVHEHKSYFLWGLVPTRIVDVSEKCPYGAAAVMEETTFVDGLADVFTLDIWTPRSSTYYCRPAPASAPEATPPSGVAPEATP